MGDAESGPLRLSFNSQLRVECRGATVTSDAGLLLPHEWDERLGLSALIERHLTDPRTNAIASSPWPPVGPPRGRTGAPPHRGGDRFALGPGRRLPRHQPGVTARPGHETMRPRIVLLVLDGFSLRHCTRAIAPNLVWAAEDGAWAPHGGRAVVRRA
jgi:hypothetical protein